MDIGRWLFTALGRLRFVGFAEGTSFLLLLLIAMPLKYLFDLPQAVQVLGLAHGVLFVVYILLAIQVGIEKSWSLWKILLLFMASIIPLGTFWADYQLLKNQEKA